MLHERDRFGLNSERNFARRSAELGQSLCVDALSFLPFAWSTGLCLVRRGGL